MSEPTWQVLVVVYDTISAQLLTDRLNSEGVPTRVRSDTELLGMARACQIFVPAELHHRARFVLDSERFSDSELAWLATGRLGTDRTG